MVFLWETTLFCELCWRVWVCWGQYPNVCSPGLLTWWLPKGRTFYLAECGHTLRSTSGKSLICQLFTSKTPSSFTLKYGGCFCLGRQASASASAGGWNCVYVSRTLNADICGLVRIWGSSKQYWRGNCWNRGNFEWRAARSLSWWRYSVGCSAASQKEREWDFGYMSAGPLIVHEQCHVNSEEIWSFARHAGALATNNVLDVLVDT